MNKYKINLRIKHISIVLIVTCILLLSIFIPSKLSKMYDSKLLNVIHKEDEKTSPESYQYSLTMPEQLYILSMSLNTRNILESDYAASLREKAIRTNREDTAASFAYVENSRGIAYNQLSSETAIEICNEKIASILESSLNIKNFTPTNKYRGTLFSAVDILEPQKNVSVWQFEYDSSLPPIADPFALLEAYIDVETGAVYSFAVRINEPIEFDADALAKSWIAQLNIDSFTDITQSSTITEPTMQYKKYTTQGLNREKTVFTVGYYEGINEIFVRITN